MKATPCKIIINSKFGYVYTPKEFPSVRQAYDYGKTYIGGFYFRIYDMEGKFIKAGYCF